VNVLLTEWLIDLELVGTVYSVLSILLLPVIITVYPGIFHVFFCVSVKGNLTY
jgi:hypothetical protein